MSVTKQEIETAKPILRLARAYLRKSMQKCAKAIELEHQLHSVRNQAAAFLTASKQHETEARNLYRPEVVDLVLKQIDQEHIA